MASWYESAFAAIILIVFFIFIYAKATNKTFGEIFRQIKDLITGK